MSLKVWEVGGDVPCKAGGGPAVVEEPGLGHDLEPEP